MDENTTESQKMDELIQLSRSIREEAAPIARKLVEVLEGFGEPEIQGSYRLDLMLGKDIDIDVFADLDHDTHRQFAPVISDLFSRLAPSTVRVTNNFDNKEPNMPVGLYIWLKLTNGWKVDIWFWDAQTTNREERSLWAHKLADITKNQRYLILLTKKWLVEHNHKFMPGHGSISIYDAVLNGEIHDHASAESYAKAFLKS